MSLAENGRVNSSGELGADERAYSRKACGDALTEAGFSMGREIGRGAFSRVYEVSEKGTGRLLACKVTRRDSASEREAELLAGIRHPLFPRFCAAFFRGEQRYLVMERICGDSLEEHLKRRISFAPRQAARIAMELADGLRYLHSQAEPILYRDLKPSNIILRPDGAVRLVDLGCACPESAAASSRAGTLGYGAPEQFRSGEKYSPAVDVYSLGRVLYQLLTGADPYHLAPGAGLEELCRCGYGGLLELAERCAEPEPADRVPDMTWLLELLEPYADSGRRPLWESLRGRFSAARLPEYLAYKNIWKSAAP